MATNKKAAGNRTNRSSGEEKSARLLILPVRGAVLFPHNILPLTAGKEWSAKAIQRALKAGDSMGIVAQRDPEKMDAGLSDLYSVGTEARILKIIRFPDGTQGAVVQGSRRFRILNQVPTEMVATSRSSDELYADVQFFEEERKQPSLRVSALGRGLRQLVQKAVTLSPNVPNEANLFVENVSDPGYLADLVIPYLGLDFEQKQKILEIADLEERLQKVHYHLTQELEVLEVSQKIHTEVRTEVGKQQRRYYLKEQLKLLQKELGEIDGREGGNHLDEAADLGRRIAESTMPTEARQSAQREADRMNLMQPGSPEYMVSHSYVSWLLDMPWGTFTQQSVDLALAQKILDDDHFGLEKIKRRILEYLAVYSLKSDLKGPILLLSGPPGVGKTSLGRSVARALGRKFVRISLGGLRDEAEIRGHRRTYIGSMPGKIIDSLKKAGSMDPVILLDEIDKLGYDMRGDPASALLEVLDPEQNHNFVDHYLNVPMDLSKVMFIATANTVSNIPAPLLDRMEPIALSGYTLLEKMSIAKKFLMPQVIAEHGLSPRVNLSLTEPALRDVIELYTREAGVRQLKRELAGIARGTAKTIVESRSKKTASKKLNPKDVELILGTAKYMGVQKAELLPPGVSLGLAYTPVGGDVLYVEAATHEGEGTGKLMLTGQLGDVMKESVQTALSFLRAHASQLADRLQDAELANRVLKRDIHVHFPEGAIPKDGPSAGVAVLCALASLALGKRLSNKMAMTGEISLRGAVLPVGGIKEKLLAAHRHGVKTILVPQENAKDLDDLPPEVRSDLTIHLVRSMGDALDLALDLSPGQRRGSTPHKTSTSSRLRKERERSGATAR